MKAPVVGYEWDGSPISPATNDIDHIALDSTRNKASWKSRYLTRALTATPHGRLPELTPIASLACELVHAEAEIEVTSCGLNLQSSSCASTKKSPGNIRTTIRGRLISEV